MSQTPKTRREFQLPPQLPGVPPYYEALEGPLSAELDAMFVSCGVTDTVSADQSKFQHDPETNSSYLKVKVPGELGHQAEYRSLAGRDIRINFRQEENLLPPMNVKNIHIKRCEMVLRSALYFIDKSIEEAYPLDKFPKGPPKEIKEKMKSFKKDLMFGIDIEEGETDTKKNANTDAAIEKYLNVLQGVFKDKDNNTLNLADPDNKIIADYLMRDETKRIKRIMKEMSKDELLGKKYKEKPKEQRGPIGKFKAKDAEARYTSDKRTREGLISVIPSDNNETILVEICLPSGDKTSADRKGAIPIAANEYAVTKLLFRKDKGGQYHAVERYTDTSGQSRSGSFVDFKIGYSSWREWVYPGLFGFGDYVAKAREKNTQDSVENYIQRTATDHLMKQLMVKVRAGKKITPADVRIALQNSNFAITSLLTPARQSWGDFFRSPLRVVAATVFGAGIFYWAIRKIAEFAGDYSGLQLAETQIAIDKIKKGGGLVLTGPHTATVKKYLESQGIKGEECDRLLTEAQKPFNPTIILQNFGANRFAKWGRKLFGIEDRLNSIARNNHAAIAMKMWDDSLAGEKPGQFTYSKMVNGKKVDGLPYFRDFLTIKLAFGSLLDFKGDTKHWESHKEEFSKNLDKLYELYQNAPNEKKEKLWKLYESMCLFQKYMDYSLQPYRDNVLHNYMPAVFADALARSMDINAKKHCKSGEDRTGAEQIVDNLMVKTLWKMKGEPLHEILADDKQYVPFLKDIWLQFKDAAINSNSIDITGINVGGAAGIQFDDGFFPATLPSDIKGAIKLIHKLKTIGEQLEKAKTEQLKAKIAELSQKLEKLKGKYEPLFKEVSEKYGFKNQEELLKFQELQTFALEQRERAKKHKLAYDKKKPKATKELMKEKIEPARKNAEELVHASFRIETVFRGEWDEEELPDLTENYRQERMAERLAQTSRVQPASEPQQIHAKTQPPIGGTQPGKAPSQPPPQPQHPPLTTSFMQQSKVVPVGSAKPTSPKPPHSPLPPRHPKDFLPGKSSPQFSGKPPSKDTKHPKPPHTDDTHSRDKDKHP